MAMAAMAAMEAMIAMLPVGILGIPGTTGIPGGPRSRTPHGPKPWKAVAVCHKMPMECLRKKPLEVTKHSM